MIILGIILSYLVGSIPSAYIFAKLYKGIDIREHGSGNIGATNVFRVLGKNPGIVVLLADIFKGILAVGVLSGILGLNEPINLILLSISVVSGHNWTIFLHFKGGKGIATSLGVLIALTIKIAAIRPVLLLVLLIWLLCFVITGFVSLSSIIATIFLPIIMVIINLKVATIPFEVIIMGVLFCIFVVLRHRPNIKRLISGREPKVKMPFKSKK